MNRQILGIPDERGSYYNGRDRFDLAPDVIFVYGSNVLGIHGAGAAKDAMQEHNATWGKGEGLQGTSYGVPTCSRPGMGLPLVEIRKAVDRFAKFVQDNPHLGFFVTAIGTGYAGYPHSDIAPMFVGIPRCWFPNDWHRYIEPRVYS